MNSIHIGPSSLVLITILNNNMYYVNIHQVLFKGIIHQVLFMGIIHQVLFMDNININLYCLYINADGNLKGATTVELTHVITVINSARWTHCHVNYVQIKLQELA